MKLIHKAKQREGGGGPTAEGACQGGWWWWWWWRRTFVKRMTVIGRGPVFQPILTGLPSPRTCSHQNEAKRMYIALKRSRQTERQTERQTDRQTDRLTD